MRRPTSTGMRRNCAATPKPLQQSTANLEELFQTAEAAYRQAYLQNAKLKQQVGELKQYLESAGIYTMYQQYGSMIHYIRAGKLLLQRKEQEATQLRQEVAREEAELEALNRELAEKQHQMQFLDDAEIIELKYQISRMQEQQEQLKSEDLLISSQYNQRVQENIELSKEKEDLENQKSMLLQKSYDICYQLQQATQNYSRFQKQKDSIEQRVAAAQEELEKIKKSNFSQLRQMDGLVSNAVYHQNKLYQAYNVLKYRLKLIDQDMSRSEVDIIHKQKQAGYAQSLLEHYEKQNYTMQLHFAQQLELSSNLEMYYRELDEIVRTFCTRYIGDCRDWTLEEALRAVSDMILDSKERSSGPTPEQDAESM